MIKNCRKRTYNKTEKHDNKKRKRTRKNCKGSDSDMKIILVSKILVNVVSIGV